MHSPENTIDLLASEAIRVGVYLNKNGNVNDISEIISNIKVQVNMLERYGIICSHDSTKVYFKKLTYKARHKMIKQLYSDPTFIQVLEQYT